MDKSRVSVLWFRQDLRIADNPALIEACKDSSIVPIYILDDKSAGDWKYGAASRWFLFEALTDLNKLLDNQLLFFEGDASEVLIDIVKEVGAESVYWNRCYEPWAIERDSRIKKSLKALNISVQSFNSSLLWEPWAVLKKDGTPYKVFTPFYRKGCLVSSAPRMPLEIPSNINCVAFEGSKSLSELGLRPKNNWYKKFENIWDVSSDGVAAKLRGFLDEGLDVYREGRNFPSKKYVSALSPYLRFGMISPNMVWYAAISEKTLKSEDRNLDTFLSELGWREFSYYLLYHFPQLPSQNLQRKFDAFPWNKDPDDMLEIWEKGLTGYPLVDAGMRELYQTGYMHNRLRMVVGSFLVKNLLIDWREGEKWFWDCLVDADLASNSAGWQWIAGCGADAAPYFRIFNPITQSEKFDSEGAYIRKYVPELSKLPSKYIHAPWQAPEKILKDNNVELGVTYPLPIVDIKESRQAALEAFSRTKLQVQA